MKRNNGFTLVELLAVIAILAILVIVALPNVINVFNDAKKKSFTTELKNIYSVSKSSFMNESIANTSERIYARSSIEVCINELSLSGRTNINYYIKFNKLGKIIEFYASDGTYQYKYIGSGLLEADIKEVDTIAALNEEEILKITCNGIEKTTYVYTIAPKKGSNKTYHIGDVEPSGYSKIEDAIKASYGKVFLKHTIQNGLITQMQVGFKRNGQYYYIKGADDSAYDSNKQTITNAFSSGTCFYNNAHTQYRCEIDNDSDYYYAYIDDTLGVMYYDNSLSRCFIKPNGEGKCENVAVSPF